MKASSGSSGRCSDELLRLALRDDEDSPAVQAMVMHIDQCSRCRTRIEELAAPLGVWHAWQETFRAEAGALEAIAAEWCDAANEEWDRRRGVIEVAVRSLAPPSHPEMLGRLGRFDIERVIGAGGMGVVLKGFDTDLNRPVAIKVLAPHLATVAAARRRFAREARAAAAVAHEHVVAIHGVESEHTPPYLVMRYIAGESLQQRLDRHGPLDARATLRIAVQVAAGLAAAHAQGLVHRDIKPANILLAEGTERVTITDFGLARAAADASVTCSGSIAGTPQFMSPEQARGESVDPRSDLFSLGSVMYAMLAGRPPFRAESPYGVLKRICDDKAPVLSEYQPDVSPWLVALIENLHEKDPAARIASAAELATLLEQCLAHIENPSVAPLPEAVMARVRSRRRALSWGWAPKLVAAGLAVGLVAAAIHWGAPRPVSVPLGETSSPEADPLVESVDASWRDLQVLQEDVRELEIRSQSFWER